MNIFTNLERKTRVLFLLFVCLIFFSSLLWFSSSTLTLRQYLQINHVPSELLSYNKLGEIFYKLGLIEVIPNHSERYRPNYDDPDAELDGPFQKRRKVRSALITPGNKYDLIQQASDRLQGMQLHKDNVYISLITEDDNIEGERGILTNYEMRGKNWERLAYLALSKGNEIIQNSAVGLRLHGGSSRHPSLEKHSYRLYFRKIYGENFLQSSLVFPRSETLRTLVVHVDWPEEWPLNNVIANELYELTGVPTLDYAPARFFLNGHDEGLYWVSPHLSKKYIQRKFAMKKIYYQRYKGNESTGKYKTEIGNLAYNFQKKLTLETVKKSIDIDGLVNYFIAVTYSGNTDWNQGVAFRNAEDKGSIWQWIAWDVDHSFIDFYRGRSKNPSREVWQQDGLNLLLQGDVKRVRFKRQLILRRLFIEDPTFLKVFIERYAHVLNHELSVAKLEALYNKYFHILETHGSAINPNLLRFFQNRHGVLREELSTNFNISFQKVIVEGEENSLVLIDDFPEKLPYVGMYPTGYGITIQAVEQGERGGYWLVDGEKNSAKNFALTISKTAVIKRMKN